MSSRNLPSTIDPEVESMINRARRKLAEASEDAAEVLIDEMHAGDKSADRIRAAETILKDTGVLGGDNQVETTNVSEALLELIKGVGQMFGVTADEVRASRAKNVTKKRSKKVEEVEYEEED